MSRDRRLKIEGGAFFYTLALADGGGNATELSGRFGERARGHGASRLGHPALASHPAGVMAADLRGADTQAW